MEETPELYKRLNDVDPELVHEYARLKDIEKAVTDLFVAAWRGVQIGDIDPRSAIGDTGLRLRGRLNPNPVSDPEWLPEPLASERKAEQKR